MELTQLDFILKPLPEACYILSFDGTIQTSNAAGNRILGFRAEDIHGQNIVDFVHDETKKIMAYLSRCGGNGQFVPGTITWRGNNDQHIATKAEGAMIRQDRDSDAYILLRCRPREEVTDTFSRLNKELVRLKEAHHQLETDKSKLEDEVNTRTAALMESELRCRGIVEAAAEGILTFQPNGSIDDVNNAAAEMFGYSADEVMGRDIRLLLPDLKDKNDIQNFIEHTSEEKNSDQGRLFNEMMGLSKDGKEICIEYSISQVQLGTELLYIAIMRDISKRKETEKQLATYANNLAIYTTKLEQKNTELDQFAYVTSHDLKAPLRAISNLASWIEEDMEGKLEDGTREQLELLRGRVYRMEALIDGILQYSRVGRSNTELETVDTKKLVDEVIDSLQPPKSFHIDIQSTLPTLETSRIWLQQVFANLISNAIKYHDRADGKIAIAVEDADDFYAFSVSDDGPGIESKFHEKIFIIFQTLVARDTRESTGIGLTIVKKIIEEQNGTIAVDSEPGKGTTFRFLWPKHPSRGEQYDG